jgi:hypothetical protein
MEFNPIVCVDFDGVIHSYVSGWQGVDVITDPPVPGAIAWLKSMLPPCTPTDEKYTGPIAVIYSSRSKDPSGIAAMKVWLIKHGMEKAYFYLDILQFPTQKPPAWLTIDDRAICFTGTFPTAEEIVGFKPWNK